jgi:hypothetical protein
LASDKKKETEAVESGINTGFVAPSITISVCFGVLMLCEQGNVVADE